MKSSLKILFTTTNRSQMVCVNALHYFEQAVGQIAECKWARQHKTQKHETRHQTVKRIMPDCDVVFWAGMGYNPPPPKDRSYKIGLFTSDIHHSRGLGLSPQGLVKQWNKANFDAYFMSYTQLKYKANPLEPIDPKYYIKNLKAPIFHLCPSVSQKVFQPSNKPKQYDVAFLAQAHHNVHPFRYQIKNGLPDLASKHGWRLIMRGRPPGRTAKRRIPALLKQGYLVGPKYAETLARSKAFIFGLGRFKYPCLKFFEGMASATCVFSDPPLTGRSQYLIPDYNFVEINESNWQTKLQYYMENNKKRIQIARNGYQSYLKHHTSEARAKQFIEFLENHNS